MGRLVSGGRGSSGVLDCQSHPVCLLLGVNRTLLWFPDDACRLTCARRLFLFDLQEVT